MDEIIISLGDQNEYIKKNDLYNIEEEIDSIDEKEYFKLAKFAIELGKPQVLEYLVSIFDFNKNEIAALCEEIKKYEKTQTNQIEDSDDEEDIKEILEEYKDILKKYIKLPYKKKKNTSR